MSRAKVTAPYFSQFAEIKYLVLDYIWKLCALRKMILKLTSLVTEHRSVHRKGLTFPIKCPLSFQHFLLTVLTGKRYMHIRRMQNNQQ